MTSSVASRESNSHLPLVDHPGLTEALFAIVRNEPRSVHCLNRVPDDRQTTGSGRQLSPWTSPIVNDEDGGQPEKDACHKIPSFRLKDGEGPQ
jgi:hypothetical protein